MALADMGAEMLIIYGDPTKFQIQGGDWWVWGIDRACNPDMVKVGCLPHQECKVSIAPVLKYITGTDMLCGLALQMTIGELRLRERDVLVSRQCRQY